MLHSRIKPNSHWPNGLFFESCFIGTRGSCSHLAPLGTRRIALQQKLQSNSKSYSFLSRTSPHHPGGRRCSRISRTRRRSDSHVILLTTDEDCTDQDAQIACARTLDWVMYCRSPSGTWLADTCQFDMFPTLPKSNASSNTCETATH